MIKFRQKIFLSPATRIAIKTRRILRPTKYGFRRATKKSLNNVKDIGNVLVSSSDAVKNVSSSALIRLGYTAPPNHRAAYLMSKIPSIKDAAHRYERLAGNNIANVGERVGKIIDRTPSALIGPAIPIPGATEALGVAGPFIDEFTPISEIIKPIAKSIKKGVKYIRKTK